MQPGEDHSIDELRRELAELTEYQNASPPLVKVPPGTRTRDGRDVSGQWIWGSLAPLWMISWNLKRQRELQEKISELTPPGNNGDIPAI